MTASFGAADVLLVPELGPSLGRLTEPPDAGRCGPLGVTVEDLRLELTTRIFELAGASRRRAATGDREGAFQSLDRAAWLDAWDRAVAAAAARLTEAINLRLRNAAAESRLPAKRLRRLLLSSDDTGAMAARLGRGAAGFVVALDTLTSAAAAAATAGERGAAEWRAWQDALVTAARRLEAAWLALEAAVEAEQAYWQPEIARVRAWRRPVWPLWLITAVVLIAATYLGLLLGGYLPAPPPLRGLVDAWGWGSGRWI
jgi:hypothetical protein